MAPKDGLFDAPGQKPEKFKPGVENGELLSTAVSVMIKELRRGNELHALYWAKQIEGRYHKYLWRRLAIFCAEDIGIANPQAIASIEALRSSYEIAKKESQGAPDSNLLSMAVLMLARSPKNREADHLKNVVSCLSKQVGWRPEIPEDAIDGHTAEGKLKYRTDAERAKHWFFRGSHCENEQGPYDYRLWHWENLARRGVIDKGQVAEQRRIWEDAGQLVAQDILPPPRITHVDYHKDVEPGS